jgi:hypothetical protein
MDHRIAVVRRERDILMDKELVSRDTVYRVVFCKGIGNCPGKLAGTS